MVRFLNPSKVGLLILIELYVDGAVPSDGVLPVLSFLHDHLTDHPPDSPDADHAQRWSKAERAVSLIVSIKDFEKLLGSYPFVMGMPGRRLWDQFLDKLWAIHCLDQVHDYFDELCRLLVKTRAEKQRMIEVGLPPDEEGIIQFTPHSLFGTFVRTSRMEYHRLSFHEATQLWEKIVRYRQPTAQYMKRRIPGFGQMSFDSVLSTGEQQGWNHQNLMDIVSVTYGDMPTEHQSGPVPVSGDNISSLLEFQIAQVQKYGNRVPIEIRRQFRHLLEESSIKPSLAHYISFLDAWRGGDYPNAFDLLHRYFDFTMTNTNRFTYQYALMNLAVLQADFGSHREGLTTMIETVSVAREHKDKPCLNFSLNWLFHFGRANPDLVRDLVSHSMLGTAKENLGYLRFASRETGMWAMLSAVHLSEAKLGIINGDSVAAAVEWMVRGSHIFTVKNMHNMFGAHLSFWAALWDRLGVSAMSSLTCEVFLRCHARNSTFDDELRISCRLAMMLADRGRYDEALGKLEVLAENSLRSLKPSQYWHKCRGIIMLKRDLCHNNLEGADQLLSQIMQSGGDDLEPDVVFTVDALHVDYLIRRGDFQAAFAKIGRMTSQVQAGGRDVALRVKVLLMRASLLDKCGRARRGFSAVMRAVRVSWEARNMLGLWEAIGALSNILVSMGEFEAASQLLYAVIPRSLECDMASLSGQLYSYLADATMGLAGRCDAESTERLEYMLEALEAVNNSLEQYTQIEDMTMQCQMMAKMGMVTKLSGDTTLAAEFAAEYAELQKKAAALRIGE